MKQKDKDRLLIHECRNDEQRIKLLEFYRFLESRNIGYETYSIPVSELRIPDNALESFDLSSISDLTIDFDILIPSRKVIFNLFASSDYSEMANKTEAMVSTAVAKALGTNAPSDLHDTLVAAVRRHLIAMGSLSRHPSTFMSDLPGTAASIYRYGCSEDTTSTICAQPC